MTPSALARHVLRCELKRLIRDRRALLFAVVIPMVAFPLIFLFSGKLEDVGRKALEAREVHVGADLAALDPADASNLLGLLSDPELGIVVVEVSLDDRPSKDEARAMLEERGDHLLVVARAPEEAGDPPALLLFFDDADETSDEAVGRVRSAARTVLREARDTRLFELVGSDPGARFETEAVDVARPEDTAGKSLGGLLPLLAVILLISGGSFAALDAFAGEREAGTLETLLVQPAPASAVATGKFLAVFLTGTTAFLGNSLSLFLCLVFGLGELPSLPPELDWSATAARMAFACFLFLPTAVLVSAVLSLVAARARTFRQGQLLTMPLSFLAIALAAPAMQSTTELGPVLALIPITGAALMLRDAAAGSLAALPLVLCVMASSVWAVLALRQLATTLDAERLLATANTHEESAARRLHSGRAIRFGAIASVVIYVVGGRIQAQALFPGLLITLWGLVLPLAVFAAWRSAGRTGESLSQALGLTRPPLLALAGALLLAPGLAFLSERLLRVQQELLPMPSSFATGAATSGLTDHALPVLLLVLAISPAICEELLFRGALLGSMRRDLRPHMVVLWQALLFGIVHASIYRFVPTALAGACLALVTLRARSLVPAMVLHAAYNGLLVTAATQEIEWLTGPWLALLAIPGVLALRSK